MFRQFLKKIHDEKNRWMTARTIARKNQIGYISNAVGEKVNYEDVNSNKYFLNNGKFLVFHPANDGFPTSPYEWYGEFDGQIKKIIDNQTSYKNITNLNEIILQMINIFIKYIDESVLISPNGFALKLEDKITANYHGRAKLVITSNAVCNSVMDPDQVLDLKRRFLNSFLDHFLGWNFGVIISSNREVEETLIHLNCLTIEKGLRQQPSKGISVWQTSDVMQYNLFKGEVL